MLVAFQVTFYTSTCLGFALYAVSESEFWWQVALWSNVAGVLSALLAAAPGYLGRLLAARTSQGLLDELGRARLELAALALFVVNLLAHRGHWSIAHDVVRVPGQLQAVVLPDPWLAFALTGLGLVLTLLAGFFAWVASQTEPTEQVQVTEQPRLEPRPSRNSLVPT